MRRGCSSTALPSTRARGPRCRSKRRSRSASPTRWPSRCRTWRSSCSAATATPPSTTWSGCTAMPTAGRWRAARRACSASASCPSISVGASTSGRDPVPHVEVEPGVSLYAQDVGEGPPVVLIAGFGLSHEVWDDQVRALGDRHRVLCVDLRGTGRSDKPLRDYDTYSVERLATDVEIVLDHLDVHDAAVVGWSFGGQIAFQLAASVPERLSRLVLVASNAVRASRSDEFPFGATADALEAALVRGEIERRFESRRATLRSGFYREPEPDLLDWLLRCQLQM